MAFSVEVKSDGATRIHRLMICSTLIEVRSILKVLRTWSECEGGWRPSRSA